MRSITPTLKHIGKPLWKQCKFAFIPDMLFRPSELFFVFDFCCDTHLCIL